MDINIKEKFEEVLVRKDPALVWDFLALDFGSVSEGQELKYKMDLLAQPWHQAHEEIVSNFQWKANPLTIESLYQLALNAEIERMEYRPIARKCTWALADIGTQEAKAKLEALANLEEERVRGFARKRLANWEAENHRKGLKIWSKSQGGVLMKLDTYDHIKPVIHRQATRIVTAHQTKDALIVYQAFNREIAEYAVQHQQFGGSSYSFNRMSWIKPNFLWMMYRSGWAQKENQERILAISISKSFFLSLLKEGEMTSFIQSHYTYEQEWKTQLRGSGVRIQWDPHHSPSGQKLNPKAIQIGIKGRWLKEFGTKQIIQIEDITEFVQKQRFSLWTLASHQS